jgi:IQ domain-containing protein H
LSPEASGLLPPTAPLSTILYYSPKCLNRIRALIKGQSAYIVPNILGDDDLKIAVFLDLPMLSPEPSIARSLSSCNLFFSHYFFFVFVFLLKFFLIVIAIASGSKRIFAEAVVAYPLGAHDIFTEDDLHEVLSGLILEQLSVQRWLIKLDDETGARGIAYFEPTRLRLHSDLLRESLTSSKFTSSDVIAFNKYLYMFLLSTFSRL